MEAKVKRTRKSGKKVQMESAIKSEKKVFTIDDYFFADVEKIESKSVMPDFDFLYYNSSLIKHKVGDNNSFIVNSCSDNYLLLPNKELFLPLEEELKKYHGDKLSIKREIKNYSQFYVDYSFDDPNLRSSIMANDILIPKISIQNSYNGRLNYGLVGGLYRLVCSNGLSVLEDSFDFNIELSHCGNNINKIISNTLDNVNEFLKNFNQIVQQLSPLYEQKVKESDVEDLVDEVLSNTKVLLSMKKDIVSRIIEENKTKGIEINLWSVYNGVNYFLQPDHNEWLSCASDTRRKMDQKVLNYIFEKVA